MTSSFFANKRKSSMDFLLILLLMCVFSGFALLLVSIGANAYNNVLLNVSNNSELRLPLTFISNKIHQGDQYDSISLETKENVEALVLTSSDGQNIYENWLFVYDGSLRELLVKKGDSFSLADGVKVMDLNKLEIKMESTDLVKISSFNSRGESLDLYVNLRSI